MALHNRESCVIEILSPEKRAREESEAKTTEANQGDAPEAIQGTVGGKIVCFPSI